MPSLLYTVCSPRSSCVKPALDPLGKGQYTVWSPQTTRYTEAFANGTSITFEVITSAAANLGTPTVIGSSAVIATAALTLGKNIVVRLNPTIAGKGQRYLGARYTVVGTMNAGKVTADIVETIGDGQKYYASGFTVA